jgi:hypothetical protein
MLPTTVTQPSTTPSSPSHLARSCHRGDASHPQRWTVAIRRLGYTNASHRCETLSTVNTGAINTPSTAAGTRRSFATVQDPPVRHYGGLKDQDRIFTNIYSCHDHGIKGAMVCHSSFSLCLLACEPLELRLNCTLSSLSDYSILDLDLMLTHTLFFLLSAPSLLPSSPLVSWRLASHQGHRQQG